MTIRCVPTRAFLSGQLGTSRYRNLRNRQVAEFVSFRTQVFLRVPCLLPSDTLASVTRQSTHDPHHCGLDHVPTIVDWLAAPNASEQRVVFQLIGDVFGAVASCTVSPSTTTSHGVSPEIRLAGRSKDHVRGVVVRAVLLAAETETAFAASVLIADSKVIEDVAEFGARATLSTSQ